MVHFLKINNDETILEVNIFIESEPYKEIELSTYININNYSKTLIKLLGRCFYKNTYMPNEFIQDINNIMELRAWLWKEYFLNKNNNGNDMHIIEEHVINMFNIASKKYELLYIVN